MRNNLRSQENRGNQLITGGSNMTVWLLRASVCSLSLWLMLIFLFWNSLLLKYKYLNRVWGEIKTPDRLHAGNTITSLSERDSWKSKSFICISNHDQLCLAYISCLVTRSSHHIYIFFFTAATCEEDPFCPQPVSRLRGTDTCYNLNGTKQAALRRQEETGLAQTFRIDTRPWRKGSKCGCFGPRCREGTVQPYIYYKYIYHITTPTCLAGALWLCGAAC